MAPTVVQGVARRCRRQTVSCAGHHDAAAGQDGAAVRCDHAGPALLPRCPAELRILSRASSGCTLSQMVKGGRDIVGMVVNAAGVGVTAPSVCVGIAVYGPFGNTPDAGNIIGCQTSHHGFMIQVISP